MGSYSHLIIADYPTFTHKNEYYHELVNQLFQPEDFLKEKRPYTTKNRLIWGDAYEDQKGEYTFKGFRQTAGICRKRLEIFGTDMASVKSDWESARKIAGQNNYYNAEYDFAIQRVSYSNYIKELRKILGNKIINYEQQRGNLQDSLIADGLVISGQSISDSLYAILSAVPDEAIVEYDLSEIDQSGWVRADKAPHQINFEKIIILTEGKSDSMILEATLKLLHPAIYPYYHFMDFEGYKAEGGASALVKTIKSFAAANVKHPIIALLDNDTAGHSEMRRLPKALPSNIRAIHLPDIALADSYPSIGPNGELKSDINGLACGIEIYLGEDILLENGKYPMIRWSNFDVNMQQYQGAFENKDEIQRKFKLMAKKGEPWKMPEMELVWSQIFNAFKK